MPHYKLSSKNQVCLNEQHNNKCSGELIYKKENSKTKSNSRCDVNILTGQEKVEDVSGVYAGNAFLHSLQALTALEKSSNTFLVGLAAFLSNNFPCLIVTVNSHLVVGKNESTHLS